MHESTKVECGELMNISNIEKSILLRNVVVAATTQSDKAITDALVASRMRPEKGLIYCLKRRMANEAVADLKYLVLRRSGKQLLDGLIIGRIAEIARRGDSHMSSMLDELEGRPWDDLSTDPGTALRIVALRYVSEADNPLPALIKIKAPQGHQYHSEISLGISKMFG
jgi:hypothetical protein